MAVGHMLGLGTRRLTRAVAWLLSTLPLFVLGPAPAMSPPEPVGYLLYPQSNLCVLPAKDDASMHARNPHRFRPRLTQDAVLPMSAGDILAQSLSRQRGG